MDHRKCGITFRCASKGWPPNAAGREGWKKATLRPLVGGISAGILGVCLTGTSASALKMIYDADQAALQTKLAEVQGMAETNKAAFAVLATSIRSKSWSVTGVNGETEIKRPSP
jgi:hypothetical protein